MKKGYDKLKYESRHTNYLMTTALFKKYFYWTKYRKYTPILIKGIIYYNI